MPTPHADPTTAPRRPAAELGTVASLKRLIPFVRPALPRLSGGLAAALGASLCALALPRVLEWLVNGPLVSGVTTHDYRALGLAIGLFAIIGLGEAALIRARRALVLEPSTHVEARLRTDLFDHLVDLPVAFHDQWPSGQLLSRSMSDLGLLRRWVAFGIVQLVVCVVTVVVGVAILVATNVTLGLIYVAGAIPVTIIAFRFSRRIRVVARRSQDQAGDLATTVEESVHGIRVLKAFGRGPEALSGFTVQADELRTTELRKAQLLGSVSGVCTAVPEVALGVALLIGLPMVADGSLTVGALVAFFATAAVVNTPVVDLGMILSMTLNTRTAVDRYFDVMQTPVTVADPAQPVHLDPAAVTGRLDFRDVHFRYSDAPAKGPEGPRDVIDGATLSVPPGVTMALVGATGEGKTTLAMLVPRLYDVTSGSVTIDDVDVRNLTRENLRTIVAVAFEDATLFSASVRDNVLLGASAGFRDDTALGNAIDVAQARFVYDLPDGVDTTIGEEGMSLSGGQRQRIALARAIAARPRILVLDDPLSALDVDTEARIQSRLRQALAGTTTIVVAHRPSTVELADLVAVMQDGRIVAVGAHHDLLATHEYYRYLIASIEAAGPGHEDTGQLQVTLGVAAAEAEQPSLSGAEGRHHSGQLPSWQEDQP